MYLTPANQHKGAVSWTRALPMICLLERIKSSLAKQCALSHHVTSSQVRPFSEQNFIYSVEDDKYAMSKTSDKKHHHYHYKRFFSGLNMFRCFAVLWVVSRIDIICYMTTIKKATVKFHCLPKTIIVLL